MAIASKRVTRKEIRQPDRFLVLVQQAIEFVRDQRSLIIAIAALFVVLLISVGGWRLYKDRQDAESVDHFAKAMALYQAEKYKEAVPAFEKVQSYRWSHYASLAYLYETDAHLASNDLNRALTSAQRFIAATEPGSFYRQMGLATLAHIEELKAQCREAIQHYAEAEKITGPYKDRAILGKARCYAQLGNTAAAIAAYRQYLSDNPTTPDSTSVALQIAELESKVTSQPAKK